MNFLRKVPGFRSGNKRNKNIAGVFYGFMLLSIVAVFPEINLLAMVLSVAISPFAIFGVIDLFKKKKDYGNQKKATIIYALVSFALFVVSMITTPTVEVENGTTTESAVLAESDNQANSKVDKVEDSEATTESIILTESDNQASSKLDKEEESEVTTESVILTESENQTSAKVDKVEDNEGTSAQSSTTNKDEEANDDVVVDNSSSSNSSSSNSGGGTVYWTPSGKSYHSTKSCSTLSRSKTIYSGTQAESGKSDPCDKCMY